MLRNYFKTAFRSLLKNKVTGFINIMGLSIGMTAAVFIFLWVKNEMSFDNFHPGFNHLYRITSILNESATEKYIWENVPFLMAETAVKEIPEIEKEARMVANDYVEPVLNVNQKLFSEKKSAWIDNGWFTIFHYDFIAGSATAFNKDPFSIILTESKAKKYFGELEAVGQVIMVDSVNYTVKGVIKDNPVNSSFQFDILLQLNGMLTDPAAYKNTRFWNNFGYVTFFQLRTDANQSIVEAKLKNILDRNRKRKNVDISLLPLQQMYFDNTLDSSQLPHGNKKTVYIFSILGFLLLITACVNYVNLTTAKAGMRVKEVSVRKIIGANKKHLFLQFIAESATISLISVLVTLLLLQLCLPAFNYLTAKAFTVSLNSSSLWFVIGLTLLTAVALNGIYPALLLSSFKPLNIFRGKSVLKLHDGSIRRVLVVFQFTLSIFLIIGTIVIYDQLHYIQTTNPGYNVSQVMAIKIPWQLRSGMNKNGESVLSLMKHSLQAETGISTVSIGNASIENVRNSSSGNADWDGRDTSFNPTIAQFSVDASFRQLFQLQLIAGRWFNEGNEDALNFIVNETALRDLTIAQPVIGQRFTWGADTGRIIGVVKDFHYKNLHEKIGPMVLMMVNHDNGYVFAKTTPGNTSKAIIAAGQVWAKYIPDTPFNYTFLDDSFNTLYKSDIKVSQLIFIFSGMAIIIAALGLFGLAAFTAEQRSKEIGIRKVLGASVQQIATLLSKDFIKLVAVAILIASPIGWWTMNKWLQDFAYRVPITVWMFCLAGLSALVIALISVGVQSVKAGLTNPVESLRSE